MGLEHGLGVSVRQMNQAESSDLVKETATVMIAEPIKADRKTPRLARPNSFVGDLR